MPGLLGSSVSDANFKLRFCIIIFVGILSFGAALSWKSSVILASEYQEIPVTHEQLKVKKENDKKKQTLEKKIIRKQLEE